MTKLVECVPNFSEGRNRAIIDAITAQIASVKGATLLDVDPGEATNRTVVTFVAEPEAALEAAFLAIKQAAELIDMRQHRGAHARQGATDVCPFVPVAGLTLEDCVALARQLAGRVGEELQIPVYLYEAAASRPERQSLADIRVGEYEALAEKLQKPEWAPDFGPARFNARAGATTIGARQFLIAYNINLNTRDARIAKDIGLTIRVKGRAKRDEAGNKVRDEAGGLVRVPGLPHCRATGWFIEEYATGQVTMNLTDYTVTPIHAAFDRVEALAHEQGARVTGSEIVGLVPKEALLQTGRHYLRKQGRSTGVSERELVQMAVRSLGLNDVAPFDPQQKIIEYQVARPGRLCSLKLDAFCDELASESPAPGGGSVAALAVSMAAGLTAMVAALTYGKKGYTAHDELMDQLGARAQQLKDQLLAAVDRDTEAFDQVMAAMRLPKTTAEQQAERDRAVLEANKQAALVPLQVLRGCPEVLELAAQVADKGNQNSLSDAGVAGLMTQAGAQGAYYNVLINLQGLDDPAWCQETRAEADRLSGAVTTAANQLQQQVLQKLRC